MSPKVVCDTFDGQTMGVEGRHVVCVYVMGGKGGKGRKRAVYMVSKMNTN